jgi:hypothetical protein
MLTGAKNRLVFKDNKVFFIFIDKPSSFGAKAAVRLTWRWELLLFNNCYFFFSLTSFPALLPEKEKEPQISRWVPTDRNL